MTLLVLNQAKRLNYFALDKECNFSFDYFSLARYYISIENISITLIKGKTMTNKYSMVPNNRAARLSIFLIWHYITVHKSTYKLINFQGFCPTYTVIWTPRLFGTLEYLLTYNLTEKINISSPKKSVLDLMHGSCHLDRVLNV